MLSGMQRGFVSTESVAGAGEAAPGVAPGGAASCHQEGPLRHMAPGATAALPGLFQEIG